MLDFHLIKALHSAAGPATLDVHLAIQPGEFVAVYGPSGAGKTTLLRLLAGLTRPDDGYLRTGAQVWYDEKRRVWLPPNQRSIGFVFQDYALFPNMTVQQNLTFALPNRHDQKMVPELLELTGLEALAHRYPQQLSGGQQQRVALARALARRPQLLLLDEPLAAVDYPTRQHLQQALSHAHHQFNLTTILVSHDPAEVYALADRVVELDLGQVRQDGPPKLLAPPASTLVLHATIIELLPNQQARLRLGTDGSTLIVALPNDGHIYQPGQPLTLRPASWEIRPNA
ncbi:ABC transporter ATP-binding protein [Hymenobacter sp. GOD-10R]|uniref:ABC transporter ATP-binding protein n=1 Tax=Hymenobacter sp. GOD-10R TaxID=3093922 RepID=UPI002D77E669|nr:ABC transporter ATP-binding protein [Hymenobacter sp. GOD-10R]WRQ27240.1 ABC transporter ATP-binding protein [Hymenobacter sp. GOD-10R]